MNNKKETSGVKRAHNGIIGESRTKSFLIDRFWILERSVDIEGADFIIQRKLVDTSILDNRPPRFGIIQSKFSQDENTQHILKNEYVTDKQGNPNMEFFLVVNIGFEDSQMMCLLSANDIIGNFKLNNGSYRLPTNKLISRFLVINKSSSLDYIENSIQCVEFYKNRIYVFSDINSIEPDFDAIHPDYKRDIDYVDGNIPDLFSDQKIEAYSFILEIEQIHSKLLKFVQEIDPVEACYAAELFNYYYRGVINIPQIFNRDFYDKAKCYIEQINHLKDDGILETYLSTKAHIRKEINDFLSSNKFSLNRTSQHFLSIIYNSIDLKNLSVQNEIVPTSDLCKMDYFSYSTLQEGKIEMVINVGLHIKNNEVYSSFNEYCLTDIVHKIYELRYFEIQNGA